MRLRMLMQVVLLAAAVVASGPVKVGATAAIVDAGRVDIASVSGLAAPRIILSGDAIQLPREAFATTLIYAPPQEIRSRIAEVIWTGGVAGRETDEGWPVQVRLRGTGDYELNLNVRFSGNPGTTGRIPDVDRIITLSVVNVSASSITAVIDYPGAVATPPVDVNGDFRVDEGDAAGFWGTYGGVRGTPEYRSTSDWDGNGTIELADLAQFVDSYQGWKGKEIGPTYGNGRVYPVTGLPNVHGFAVPTPIFQARTEPAGFEPWIQWQVDGSAFQTGPVFTKKFGGQGEHTVAAGVFGANEQDTRDLVIYSARVPEFDGLVIRDGVEYTFTAETTPAGYEDYVNWFSATLYGTVTGAHARGRTYTVRFDNTWGPMPQDPSRQFSWLGVQADNLYLNQDLKSPTIMSFSPTSGGAGTIITIIGTNFDSDTMNICNVLQLSNNELVPLDPRQVLAANPADPDTVISRLGYVPPNAVGQALTLKLANGDGRAQVIIPNDPGVTLPVVPRIWFGGPCGAAMGGAPFNALGPEPGPLAGCTFNGVLAAGELHVDIGKAWGAGQEVVIKARVHQCNQGGDLNFDNVHFTGAGSVFDCAVVIKNLIIQTFQTLPHPNALLVSGTVTATPGNPSSARITLRLPLGKAIDMGTLQIRCP